MPVERSAIGAKEQVPRAPFSYEIKSILDRGSLVNRTLKEFPPRTTEFLQSPEMTNGVLSFLQRKSESLNEALEEMGWGEKKIELSNWRDLGTMGMKLTKLSMELLKENEKQQKGSSEMEFESKMDVQQMIEKRYEIPLDSIMTEAEITDGSAKKEFNPTVQGLPENMVPHAEKKFLIDLYIHGKSLNDLGGFYAFNSEKGWKLSAHHRALSDALHLTNAVNAFILEQRNMSADQLAASGGVARLGHTKVEEGEDGRLGFSAEGVTPSELAHEEVKGMLEYMLLDTSLPGKGEITEKEAEILKAYLERPSFEIVCGLYGPALAESTDETLGNFIDEVKKDRTLARTLSENIEINQDDLEATPNNILRVYKLLSMLPKDKIAEFYQASLKGRTPDKFLTELHVGKREWLKSLEKDN